MNAEEAKVKITDILQSVVNCDERYVLNGKYVKWGAVEADIHAVIDSIPTPVPADGGNSHVGIPCIYCGAVPAPGVSWSCPRA